MRFERIIAAVARRLAVAKVREITVVDQFAAACRLHLWQLRMSLLGMPNYPGSDLSLPMGYRLMDSPNFGCKRGLTRYQPLLATVGGSTGSISG